MTIKDDPIRPCCSNEYCPDECNCVNAIHNPVKPLEPVWYKLKCQHCDEDGYIYTPYKLPLYSENIDNPNSTERTSFEVLPHDREGFVRIRRKCNQCHGLKYYVFDSTGWKLEIIDPIPEGDKKK